MVEGTQSSPGRVHDLELLVDALTFLARGPASEEEVVRKLRTRARFLRRRRSGAAVPQDTDEGRGLAKGTVREVLRELHGLGLASHVSSTPQLTSEGLALARIFANDHRNAKGLRELAGLHLSRFSNLRRVLDALELAPDGLLFIPRPTPAELKVNVSTRELGSYQPYIEAAATYAAAELRNWGMKGVRSDSVLRAARRESDAKNRAYLRSGRTWTHPNMITTIRDSIARFALSKTIPGVGVVDFEIYCSRGSSLGLLNYTDRLDGAHGRVVFATSWTARDRIPTWVSERSLQPIDYQASGDDHEHFLHDPQWSVIRGRFLRELEQAYQRLNRQKRSLYVQVADVRDLVCYALRISDSLFDRFLTRVYHGTMQGKIDTLRISFEADEIKEIRGSQVTKRNPLYLATGAPRTMISVSRRKA